MLIKLGKQLKRGQNHRMQSSVIQTVCIMAQNKESLTDEQ
jgi:hypothetical protein